MPQDKVTFSTYIQYRKYHYHNGESFFSNGFRDCLTFGSLCILIVLTSVLLQASHILCVRQAPGSDQNIYVV
jgi:hypothetical protein